MSCWTYLSISPRACACVSLRAFACLCPLTDPETSSGWRYAWGHAELVSASHREPSLVFHRKPYLSLSAHRSWNKFRMTVCLESCWTCFSISPRAYTCVSRRVLTCPYPLTDPETSSGWRCAWSHAELVSASHREPTLVFHGESSLVLIRSQILKRVQDDDREGHWVITFGVLLCRPSP